MTFMCHWPCPRPIMEHIRSISFSFNEISVNCVLITADIVFVNMTV